MGYSSKTYQKALEIVQKNARKRESIYNAEIEKIYAQIPELNKIDATLGIIGSKAAITALSGNFNDLENLKKESSILAARKEEILRDAGIKKPMAECKICNDTGLVQGKYCECIKRLAKQLTFEELSKQMPLTNQKFENFDLSYYPNVKNQNGDNPRQIMKTILEYAKEYCETFDGHGESVLFMGNVGLGKTHISLSIVSEIVAKGFSVIYGSAQNLFNLAEKEHFSFSDTREKTDDMFNTDLLVIDDLGTEFSTQFTQSFFYNLINTRLLQNKPTIINTNLSIEDFPKRYTARIASRFSGEFKIFEFLGNDIRLQKALKK